MAANVENMFFVRELPWHGLGKNLEAAPTSKDAIVAAGLDWTVSANPIFDATGNEIPGYKANVRSSDQSVLGVVSNRYTIVQNAEAFDFTDSLVSDEGLHYETAGSLRNGKQIWLLGKMPEPKNILGDEVEPYICFTNTHDGTGAVRVCMTPIRVVCNNTLNLALNSAKRSWSTRHIGDIASKLSEARNTLDLAERYMLDLNETCEKSAEIKIYDADIEQFLDILYPVDPDTDSTRRIQRVAELKNDFFHCLDAEDVKKFRGTLYGLIMAATDYADHSNPARITENWKENRWGQIMVGHPFVDQMYKLTSQKFMAA